MIAIRHIVHQGPVLASLAGTAVAALRQRFGGRRVGDGAGGAVELPGPELRAELPARPAALVDDYVRFVGGEPAAYRGAVPPHLFPQWAFPLAARTLHDVPYPLIRVMNGGCRLEVNATLPAGEPLQVAARLESIDDDGRRAVLHQRVVTGTASAPDAVVAHLYAVVPLARRAEGDRGGEPKPPVPADAQEIDRWQLGRDAGLAYAVLTGDFNPVHWVRPYARAFGFAGAILHGFATMARAMEGLARGRFGGDVGAVRVLDVRFTRPLVLPADVGLFVEAERVFVGDAAGAPAYLVGSFETWDVAPALAAAGGDA
jgi:acyl dehydratase